VVRVLTNDIVTALNSIGKLFLNKHKGIFSRHVFNPACAYEIAELSFGSAEFQGVIVLKAVAFKAR
jgi:hypothetical protein